MTGMGWFQMKIVFSTYSMHYIMRPGKPKHDLPVEKRATVIECG